MIDDKDIEGMNLKALFARYLMASYLYYKTKRQSPWNDKDFDKACQRLLREWDNLEHPHKDLTNREALQAGSGFHIKDYPKIVQLSSLEWSKSFSTKI